MELITRQSAMLIIFTMAEHTLKTDLRQTAAACSNMQIDGDIKISHEHSTSTFSKVEEPIMRQVPNTRHPSCGQSKG